MDLIAESDIPVDAGNPTRNSFIWLAVDADLLACGIVAVERNLRFNSVHLLPFDAVAANGANGLLVCSKVRHLRGPCQIHFARALQRLRINRLCGLWLFR